MTDNIDPDWNDDLMMTVMIVGETWERSLHVSDEVPATVTSRWCNLYEENWDEGIFEFRHSRLIPLAKVLDVAWFHAKSELGGDFPSPLEAFDFDYVPGMLALYAELRLLFDLSFDTDDQHTANQMAVELFRSAREERDPDPSAIDAWWTHGFL